MKIAPTCFGAVTPSTVSALIVLAKVTLVKISNYGTSVCDKFGGDVAAYISRSVMKTVCYRPTIICSHITTELITHRCTIIGYFNKCNFSKHD